MRDYSFPLRRIAVLPFTVMILSCAPAHSDSDSSKNDASREVVDSFVERVNAAAADLPASLASSLAASAHSEGDAFSAEIDAILSEDLALTLLVDKRHVLPSDYEPEDLQDLSAFASATSFVVGRSGLKLRRAAIASLSRMAEAARADGVALVISSAYRSYSYQETVYNRNVRELGQEAADRESAKPGRSQHQMGIVVDFGSIDDSFAKTAASRWLSKNASSFGWSLSFPEGYEAVTGYRWESWHYRYVGEKAAAFIDRRFGGIQQYALEFLDSWKRGDSSR